MTAETAERAHGSDLAAALTAARARLGLVALLLALAGIGWWWTSEQMRGMDAGPWTALGALGWFQIIETHRLSPIQPTTETR